MTSENKNQKTNVKRMATYSAVGVAVIVTVLLVSSSALSTSGMKGTQTALADGTACLSLDTAKANTRYSFVVPPSTVAGNKDLRCIQGDSETLVFAYASAPLTKGIYDSVIADKATLIKINDVTLNGQRTFNATEEFTRTFNIVNEKRPDLKPQLLTINGHLAWGREGGPDAGITVIENATHQEISRQTQPEPALLAFTIGNIGYQIEADAPLSDLIEIAQSIK